MPTLCLVEEIVVWRKCAKGIKNEKHHTSSFHSDVRRSISTKFCVMIEDLCAIIAPS